MPKNQLAKQGRKSFTDVAEILKNPSQRTKLQSYVDETVRCKMKILDENESIKGIRTAAIEELGIQPKIFNSIVSLFFNNNFEQKREELEQLETVIETLMQTDNQLTHSKDDE